MLRKFLITLFLLSSLLLIYFYFQEEEEKIEIEKEAIESVEEESNDEKIIFEETPAHNNARYFEGVVNIDGQPMYYAYPLEIKQNNPPKLIIYSHGQLQRVVPDLNDEFMLKMIEYGDFFASRGYAFSASNQHDDNWGQEESMRDITKSVDWFRENDFLTKDKKHMLGFSMGGRAAINYAIQNPTKVKSIVLLAPTPKNNLQENDVEKILNIPIKIWHGTEDVNIPFLTTLQYIESFKTHGKDIELTPVENAGHFDIETSLMDEILEFFENV